MNAAARIVAEQMEAELLAEMETGANSDPPPELRTAPRMSALANECAHMVAHYLLGSEKVARTPASVANAALGQAVEADVLRHYERVVAKADPGATFGHQVKVETPWMRGTIDLLVRYSDGHEEIVDSKLMNSDAFDIGEREEMKPSHRAQLNGYAHARGATHIVTLERNGDVRQKRVKGEMRPYPRVYRVRREAVDPALVERVKRIAELAMQAKAAGDADIAPRAYPADHWLCRIPNGYCDYREVCAKGR